MNYHLYNIQKHDEIGNFLKYIFSEESITVKQIGSCTDAFLYIILEKSDRHIAIAFEIDESSKEENTITYNKFIINAAEMFDKGDPIQIEVSNLKELSQHIWGL